MRRYTGTGTGTTLQHMLARAGRGRSSADMTYVDLCTYVFTFLHLFAFALLCWSRFGCGAASQTCRSIEL